MCRRLRWRLRLEDGLEMEAGGKLSGRGTRRSREDFRF